MELKNIFKVELSKLHEDSSERRRIFELEKKIEALLENMDKRYPDLKLKGLLCKTNIEKDDTGKETITYKHSGLGTSPTRISNLTGQEKDNATRTIGEIKNAFEEEIKRLREKGGDDATTKAGWLQKINDNISEDHAFIGDDQQMALVAWGLEKREIQLEENLIPESVPFPDPPIPKPPVSDPPDPKPPVVDPPISDPPGPEFPDPKPPDTDPPPTKDPWWIKVLDFLKKWWWKVLALLLLFLILLLLFRGCEGCNGGIIYLPPESGHIIPIDSDEQITYDQDSLTMIVSDRLNILLRGDNKNIDQFARDFKEKYPGNEYQIIYYDDKTYRLQLRVPEDEREVLKQKMPNQFPDFDLLIWHESLFYSNQKSNTTNSKFQWHHDLIGSSGAWDVTRGKPSVIVAVLDNGFDLGHPALKNNIVKPYNVLTRNSNVRNESSDSHGTHVAGLAIGNQMENNQFSGVCPGCSFMPVKISGYNEYITTTAIIDGILYAIYSGADVINLSIEQAFNPMISLLPIGMQMDIIQNNYRQEAEFWKEIFNIADEHNSTIVMAAGNSDILVGIEPIKRNNQIISVSAVDRELNRADFTNFGSYSTVSAPGVSVLSSLYGGRYGVQDGTSMSAPIVAGGIGLLKSIDPTLTTAEISQLLRRTGKNLNTIPKNLGPLIQLDNAVRSLAGIPDPDPDEEDEIEERNKKVHADCHMIELEIMRLQRQIEELKNQCPSLSFPRDTLIIPEDTDDLSFMIGRWKSTTPLHNSFTGDPVVLYFTFRANETGELNLYEMDDTVCSAPLSLSLQQRELTINQLYEAACSPGEQFYSRYKITCSNQQGGYAYCIAQNLEKRFNRVEFNLIKID